jgi:hypothetical protein
MATVKVLELQANTDNAQASLNDVVSALDNINKTLTKTEDEFDNINQTAKKSKGAFAALKKGAKGVAGGFKLMGTALKAAGIGLIIGAFATLKELFEQNQKVVDIFSTSFEFLGLIFSQVGDAIKTVYENVSKSSSNFDALGKVLKNILNIAITPVKLAFEGIKAAIVGAQLVWEKSWLGGKDPERIKELEAELVQIKDNVIGIGEGVVESAKTIGENFVEAVTEVADIGAQVINEVSKISVEATLENAKANVELKKQAELAQVANQGLIEQYDLQAETLRQLRDDERNSIEDRKKANDELAIVLEQQQKTMLENAKISLRAAQAELKKDKDNIEFKKAVMEAENELAAVRAQVAGFRSEQQANDLALSKEELEMTNSKLESEANLSIEQKRFNAEQIEDDLQRLEKQREIDAEEKELQTARLQTVIDNANAGTQAKIDAEISLAEFLEQARQQEVTRDKEINELKVNNNKAANDEIKANQQKLKDSFIKGSTDILSSLTSLAQQSQQKFADLNKAVLDNENLTDKEKQKLLDENNKRAKKSFDDAKALQISTALINTYASAAAALAPPPVGAGPIAGPFLAGASILTGLLQVNNIRKQKFEGASLTTSSVGSSSNVGSESTSPSQPPSFNVVGQSGFNQIAGALSQQGPVQAFVVASEVTTQQQLDNAIVSTATLGN